MTSIKDNTIFDKTSFLEGSNSSFIEELYLKYINNPENVPQSWREFFDGLDEDQKIIQTEIQGPSWSPKKNNISQIIDKVKISAEDNFTKKELLSNGDLATRDGYEKEKEQSVKAIALIRAYRIRGHLIANLDPLGMMERKYLNELHPSNHGFQKEDYNKKIYLREYMDSKYATINEILSFLKKTYCSTIGAEYMHISDPNEKKWFRERMEKKENQLNFTNSGKKFILNKLIQAEGFEKFLAVKFVSTKRFGLDGGEALIPALEQIIKRGGHLGVKEIKIGMPHRGRLNVLANLLQKSYKRIFNEFAGEFGSSIVESAGDVKYHLGASSNREFDGNLVHISLTDNPSHLEAVDPVVLGQTRAKQFFHKDKKRQKVVPILIHGDAAFAGQGVVAECFAMSGLRGHNTGGTIHIIVNNQIGFTTNPRFARSSPYPSDIAKMVEAPILHVNADDPEAVVHCARVAIEFRQQFNRDVVIDMICYRRWGHNEGDEPSFTQPLMYQKIRQHPTTLNIYGEKLIKEGTITAEEFDKNKKEFKNLLDEQLKTAKEYKPKLEWFEGVWSRFRPEKGKDKRGVTGVTADTIKKIGKRITYIPEDFNAHPTIRKIFENKKKMFENGTGFDWATAEQLAFATLLEEGYPVRLSGQDSGRGTFSQRHSVLRDQKNNSYYTPLNNISKKQKRFEVIDSLLSEFAVLGFEHGYALSEPTTLVVWEAQFGDFANGAQVVIDQFIASGERKWSRASGLVMLLPHGYEGQGPEHSSARLERFLQLCAHENIQVMNCTTPANYFHALRRQIHRDFRKPLIIMTPKSLLRNKRCTSNIEDFNKKNTFHRILKDHAEVGGYGLIKLQEDKKIKKVVLCSGKIYFDLIEAREKIKNNKVLFIRIEQLYPFPVKTLAQELKKFKKNARFFWCQEEPQNMGAWNSARNYIEWTLNYIKAENRKVSYIGRKPAASPATGYLKKHLAQQKEIIEKVLS
ncbi:MAG: 2-oxoglutarate dehydrogenase E1 component [Pelagibacterales bacterium]|nr:2-oxoglutarate dehydrogenase E1 component [Pelagibacterales bacterium]